MVFSNLGCAPVYPYPCTTPSLCTPPQTTTCYALDNPGLEGIGIRAFDCDNDAIADKGLMDFDRFIGVSTLSSLASLYDIVAQLLPLFPVPNGEDEGSNVQRLLDNISGRLMNEAGRLESFVNLAGAEVRGI